MDKVFVGNSRNIQGKFGEIQKISYSKKDLETMLANLNEKGYVNLNRIAKKEVDKYGNSHYMVIDNRQPSTEQPKPQPTKVIAEVDDNFNLPF